VLRATGAKVKVRWGSMAARIWDTDTWVADPSKVRRVLKWAPKIGLAEGIERTTVWFRSNPAGSR
jgi:nucleoside-diphosphate-sugar epimerase